MGDYQQPDLFGFIVEEYLARHLPAQELHFERHQTLLAKDHPQCAINLPKTNAKITYHVYSTPENGKP